MDRMVLIYRRLWVFVWADYSEFGVEEWLNE